MITSAELNLRELRGQPLLNALELRDLNLSNTQLEPGHGTLGLWHARPTTLTEARRHLDAHANLEPAPAPDGLLLTRAADAVTDAAQGEAPDPTPLCPATLWSLLRTGLIIRAAENWGGIDHDLTALGALMRRETVALTSADFDAGLRLIAHSCPSGEDDHLLPMLLLAAGARRDIAGADERELHESATDYLKRQLDDAGLYGSFETLARSNPELRRQMDGTEEGEAEE